MKRSRSSLALILLTLVIGVIVANAQTASGSKLPVESSLQGAYVIGESDLLAISVWHEPDLTRVVPVRSDGKISLPLIGELQASGETVEKLRTTITTQLKRFLEDPEVTVSVQEPRSQFFTLVGKVVRPGSFSLGQRLTVLDGLALGGGFKDFAKLGKIYIVRTHRDGSTERLPFDYKKAVGGDLSRNFMLEARDMIIVP